jgi:hypothetical protein
VAILRNDVEAFADGAAIDTTTASPDAFTKAQLVSSGTLTARTSAAIGGSRGIEAAGPSGAIARVGWINDADTFNSVAGSARFKGRSAPSADQRIVNIIRTAGSTSCPYFLHRTTGNIELWTAGHALVTGWTATAFPTSATDIVELRLWAEKGTTSSDGKIKGAMYVNGSLVEDVDNAATNAGTATFGGVGFGRPTGATNTDAWVLDDLAFEASGSALIEAVGAVSVTVTATPAGLTLATPAPTITSETVVASTGPAAFTLTAPAPTVTGGADPSATVTAVPAALTLAAPAATVAAGARVAATPAGLNATAPAPVVTAGAAVAATMATLTITTPAPTVVAAAHVTAPAAQLTLTAPAPAVVGVRNATINTPPSTLTVDAPAPSVAAVSASTVLPPPGALTYAAPVPVITATRHATVAPPPAALTVIGGTPVPTGGSKVTAPPATLAIIAGTPVIFGATAVIIAAVPAGLTLAAHPPSATGGAVAVAPPALFTIGALAPTMPAAYRDITLTLTGPVANPMRTGEPDPAPMSATEPVGHPMRATEPRS